ncbi:MAG TPA: hypothetical protein VGU02_09280 [Gaiellaceae bacterium]|nr:hypothetical protein [Gaiellaceae bacterium]
MTARAGTGFTVNASFSENGLSGVITSVNYQWSAHMYVVMGCNGKSVTDLVGAVSGTLTAGAGGGTARGSFAVRLPSLSCANGATPKPIKMIVRSIKVTDKTNHRHSKIVGWYVSKSSKGVTAMHPFGGPGAALRSLT